jgi:peptide/nickel transport system substrate-binding protein
MPTTPDAGQPIARARTSRRRFLGPTGAGALGLSALLAACGAAPASPAATTPAPAAPASPATAPAKAAGSTPAAAAKPRAGGTLTIGTPQPIQTFDPDNPGLANNRNTFPGLYNALARFDAEMNPVPDVAERWESSNNGQTWTFTLRQGVRFHNGREMTADDVKWSIDRILNPEKASSFRTQLADIDTVEIDGKYTVKLHLKNVSASLLPALVDAKIKAPENEADLKNKAVGTGPYKLAEYIVNDRVVLERHGDYFEAGKPHLDKVIIKTLADPTALFTSFTSDAVDAYWQLPSKFVTQLQGDQNHLVLQPAKSTSYTLFMLDAASEPFRDVKARQALLHLMDRQTMLNVAYFGLGTVPGGNNVVPPGHPIEKTGYPDFPYDVKKGKELFGALGVKELKFVAPAINPEWKPISEVLERGFNEAGMKLTIELVEVNEWLKLVAIGNKWPGVITTNIYLPGWDPALIMRSYETGNNRHNYGSKELDDVLTRGKREMDAAKRKEIYGQAQDMLAKDLPTANIAHWKWSHGAHKKVQSLQVRYDGHLEYRDAWVQG